MSKIKHFFTGNFSTSLESFMGRGARACAPLIPKIVIPVGDPAGIGMEVVLKAGAKIAKTHNNYQITLVGTRKLLEQTYQDLPHQGLADPATLEIIDVPLDAATEITQGVGNAASGAASFAYLQEAIARTLTGEFAAIVTAPIAKSAWKLAGHHYPGQTEVLAAAAGVDRYGMLFFARSPHTGWQLRTLLATTHIPLSQVPKALTPELMSQKLDLLIECLAQDFGILQPRIAIAGLNPHSGEAGQLGTEEVNWLNSWLQSQREKYPQATLDGLFPPDTMWVKPGQAWYGNGYGDHHASRDYPSDRASDDQMDYPSNHSQDYSQDRPIISAHDAYLALYHDQGLIPVKLMAFDRAVNTTIGLPFVRTSPDHGTAFDIAGKGIADAQSMLAALELAANLVITGDREESPMPRGL
jgi:4-hydroxythreonine-4-phosphate dehydrogenase